MSMALKADVVKACKSAGTEKPVDLVYLSSVTMGDRDLELEVLGMFLAQIPNYIQLINSAKTKQEIYLAAHTVKGAASNVGALRLAELARNAENSGKFDLNSILAELDLITKYVSLLSSKA